MGRAMLIIVAGVLISLGITQTSVFGGLNNLVGHSTNYAETAQAKNIAYMGTELAIQEMINDEDWRNDNFTVGGGDVTVSVTDVSGTGDQFRLVSTGTFNNQTQEITLLLSKQSSSLVPTFFAAMGFVMTDSDKFDFSAGGNTTIDGTELSGSPQCSDKPGVSVNHSDDESKIENGVSGSASIQGDPPIAVNEGMTMDELSKLIELLSPHGTVLDPNRNQHDLGDKDNPGIFIVNSNVKFAGNQNKGAGIMIVRNSGKLEIEEGDDDGGLELRGGFEFDGLVIFENALSIDGRGNAEVRGSVIVGNSHDNVPKFNADTGGAATFNYDCSAQEYANLAAQGLSNNLFFQQLSVYEN